MKRNVVKQLISGIFVLVGAALVAATVFVLGSEAHLFEERVSYRLEFLSIGGLKPGAAVRLAGMEVGSVVAIELPEKIEKKKVQVIIQVKGSVKQRIRSDTVATIGSRGLLGDKAVDLTIGTASKPVVEPGRTIKTEEPPDYFAFLEKGQKILDRGAGVADSLDEVLVTFKEEGTAKDVADIMASTRSIMKQVEEGDGIAHTLIYDEKASRDLKQTMAQLKATTKNLNKGTASLDDIASDARTLLTHIDDTVGRVDRVIAAIETGNGTAHSLIYGQEGDGIFDSLTLAAEALKEMVEAIREQDGLVHKLVYDKNSGKIIEDLQVAAKQIRQITETISEGEGSLGGIINDPTVYEDLKLILGEVQRNKMLKALVRYAIEQDDKKKDKKYKIPTVEEVYGPQPGKKK